MEQARDLAEALLRQAGEDLRTKLTFDEDGECVLARDDGQELILHLQDDATAMSIYAPLLPLRSETRESMLAWAMAQNLSDELTQGTTLGLEPQTDQLVVRHRVALHGMDGTGLSGLLSNLFDRVGAITQAMIDFEHDLSPDAPPTMSASTATDFA